MTRTPARRWWWGVALVALLAVAAVPVSLWADGWRAYIVRTGSMEPAYYPGDVVFDRPATEGYDVGDVLTFSPSDGVLVTHRLAAVKDDGLRTKGDANEKRDSWVMPPSRVVGVVGGSAPKLGYVLVFMRQPTGVAGLVAVSLSLLLLWGLFFPSTAAAGSAGASLPRPQRRRGASSPAGALIPAQRVPAAAHSPVEVEQT